VRPLGRVAAQCVSLGSRLGPLALSLSLAKCGGGSPEPSPSPTPDVPLGPVPVLVSPAEGTQITSDSPTFTARNALGYDIGQAQYTFRLLTRSGAREIATATVPAGRHDTSATFGGAVPRGMHLTWTVTARSATAEVASAVGSFRSVSVACLSGRDNYAKSVVDWHVRPCSLAENHYNDPNQVLGPPNAGGSGPDSFFGFMSLGDDGYVTVDMETCAVDEPGTDVRVYQSVAREPVTLWAAGSPAGPFQLLQSKVPCGGRVPGVFSRDCEFDLADAEVDEARYFKIEDGENYPCPGDTVTEGADIDAIEVLHPKP
jgi:hypothetical protein